MQIIKMKKDIKGFLFDFDGTLADTMSDNFLAWKKAFENFEINIKQEDYFPLEGLKLIDVAKTLGSGYSLIEEDFEKIVSLKNRYYLENHSFLFYSGIIEFIDLLKTRNKLVAMVTASPKDRLNKTLSKEFLEKFNAIISMEDYEKSKPNPEPYISAVKKLDLKPEECIVIENAPLGISSAKSAGIYCIAITTTLCKKYLKEADEILESHEKLINFCLENFI